MKYARRFAVPAAILCTAIVLRGQTKPATYFLKSVSSLAAKREPLAPDDDVKAFESQYGKLVADAKSGSSSARAVTAGLLRDRSSGANMTPGMKRLLLVNAFDLATRAGMMTRDIEPYAAAAWATLDAPSIAAAKRRIGLMEVMVGLATDNPRDSATNIGQAYFELAEMCLDAGMIRDAELALDNGQAWIVDENEYRAKVGPQLDALRAAIRAKRAEIGWK